MLYATATDDAILSNTGDVINHLAESVKVAEETIVSSSASDISANSVKVIMPSPTQSVVSEAQQSGEKKLWFV